ncbi:MAG: menaquinone-dependent protoporphyrinogen IX dehydrogenase [Pseudomonadota bacterium]
MANILIIYSTTDGHTKKICSTIRTHLIAKGDDVKLVSVTSANTEELESFDKLIVGASIRYGKHSKQVRSFVSENKNVLDSKPNAFFSVNVVARKPEKNTPDTNPYIGKFLEQVPWRPQHLGVFAGVINYQIYGFFDRLMIRFIMWMTKGPTDLSSNVEFTDWTRVDEFATLIHEI